MATPTAQTTIKTLKSGIDLNSFADVKLYKEVAVIAEVSSVDQAREMLGDDEKKLLEIITRGLQGEAVEAARKNDEGWKIAETEESFSGTLISNEILNPMVLTLSKYNPAKVLRDGVEFEITWDECKTPEEKRTVKDSTISMIRETPRLLNSLKSKMAAAIKDGSATE